jgi:hypothetical protein
MRREESVKLPRQSCSFVAAGCKFNSALLRCNKA